ncbi:hypothetical protein D3C73_1246830 [compost metagenome]
MRDGLVEVGVPRVQVGVEMQQCHRTMNLVQRSQHGQGDGVVAADRDESLVLAEPVASADQGQRLLLDLADCPSDVVGGAGNIAGVHHLGFVYRFNVELRVIARAEEPGGLADCGRAETGARPEGGSAVERYSYDRDVVVRDAVDLGETGEGTESCIPGNFGCVDRADGLMRCH